ncbi:helix-turn-helix domain-containing protein [Amphritea sp. 2_MG-2023]|uniref:TrmB family transcriptional regulator n=1 Tax=Amphritea TaxID=515417 RepID=UPI001C07B82C|nr:MULTISPECIES: helix-turn-helix domain-containing protein [Amphritea]MBU2967689.1 TrmB family transcriptional regulator [Amphritea atlantica]MDO6416994.1 helix-turn-helix domain-containing protein [Amphritea sp. 2_MG-2023]MDX2422116.1 helix-turn-helix domain-containing protein [Amphritea sp.]
MNDELFELLGLSKREITLYRALLSLGPSAIRTIAEKAGINRGTSYDCLKEMQQKGIVTYLPKGKRRLFSAREPEVLLQLAEERRHSLNSAIDQLKTKVVPELHHLMPDFNTANVSYYEGDSGIEQVLRDILNTVETQQPKRYSVFSSKPIRNHLYRPFPNFTSQRILKGIEVKVIAIGEGGEDAELSERKWIKTEGKVDAAYIAVYPPKCAIISLASANYPTAVVIESKEVATAQKIIFDTLWGLL